VGAAGGRLLLAAVLAWRARARRDPEGCRRHVAAALTAAFPGGLDGPVAEVAPLPNTGGGFFCAIACGAGGGRYFTKGILASGREAALWRAWRDGAVRVEGEHYRIEPPAAIAAAPPVMVLAFPERAFMRTDWRTRDGIYAREVRRVVRAVAEFTAAHAGGAGFAAARGCVGARVPGEAAVAAALGVEGGEARAIAGRLRAVERGWPAVRRRVGGLAGRLGHMDLGPSNVVIHEGRGVLMDFGHAGLAPAGADLHTALRYGGGAEEGELLDLYVEVFSARGVALDRAAAELALRAYFAARYRNLGLRSARERAVFERALEMSERLVAGR
jgi:hypothetical protein